jgi:cytidylate kinase
MKESTNDEGGGSFMYFITFSEKIATDGSEIARRVSDQLGYRFYDTEAIESTAQEMGFLQDVKEIDEKVPSLIERLFSYKPGIYLDRLNSVIYELASRGNAVFLGRGSYILLRTFKCALHIRVIASLEKRIENLVERGWQREVAIKAIRRSDHERGAFVKFAFGVDWENPDLYDIVLNMDNLTIELASDIVLHTARSEEIKARSLDAMKSLEMMALTRRVEAVLIEADFSPTSVSVSVLEPGKIQLTGTVSEQSKKIRAGEILKEVKGIKSIDNQIKVVLHYSGSV